MARYRPRGLGLERVLGVGALFSAAYGNVGSSIYYALGLVAAFALGLTPVVYFIAGGRIVIVITLSAIHIVGVRESARLILVLAVIDFATQRLLLVLGVFLVLNFSTLVNNVHFGVAPTWSDFALSITVAMISYTGIET